MILTPEQVSNMREENRRIKERLPEYSDYFQNREISSAEFTEGRPLADFATEANYKFDINTIKRNEELLETSKFLKERTTDFIEIGTKFIVKFDHNNKKQELLLVEESVGIPKLKGFVTLNSLLGQNIRGKKENDTFSYKINTDKYTPATRVITGVVTEIKKDPKDYLHYITDKGYSSRKCRKEKTDISRLYQNRNTDEQSMIEYQKRLALAPSQVKLIQDEIKYLLRMNSDPAKIKGKVMALRKYLEKYNVAKLPTDGSIGIGTNFSVMINTPSGVIDKRFEMINRAVSTELENEYLERISLLGSKVFGLKEKESFNFKNSSNELCTGIVYDIDNSKYQIKTNDPLVYKTLAKK